MMKRMWMIPVLLAVGLMTTAFTGCAANPFKAAQGVDEQAYAALGTYAIYQRQILKIVQDQTLPAGIRQAAAQSEVASFPVLKELDKALVAFLNAKAELDKGTGSKEKVAIATTNLNGWILRSKDSLNGLKAAIRNAKTTFAFLPSDGNLIRSV